MLELVPFIFFEGVFLICLIAGYALIFSVVFLFFRSLFLSVKTHFKPELVQKDGKYAVRKFRWITGYVYLGKLFQSDKNGTWVVSEYDFGECWFDSEKQAEDNYKKVKDLEKVSKNRIKKVKNISH